MSEPDQIMDLLRYYTTGQVDPILLRKANAILGRCAPDIRASAIDWITDNIPRQDGKYRHELSITDIVNALREVGNVSEYVPAEDWSCDLCGLIFKYSQVVSYDDKHDKGIFDYCPRCGFQPYDTILARAQADGKNGNFRAWYDRLKGMYERDWKTRGKWMFGKAEDDAHTETKRRERIDTMKAEAAREISELARIKRGIE